MDQRTQPQVDGFVRRVKLLLVGFAAALLLPLLGLVIYLDWRFDSFERGLRFRPPESSNHAAAVLDALPWEPVQGQTVYVPAYSHIYHEDGSPYLLTITLSVRNADPDHELVLAAVRYFDTQGNEVKSHLNKPLRLGPLASTEFLVERDDTSGGSGASFLVDWVAGEAIVPPVIETVMIDTAGTQDISFARSGVVIRDQLPPIEPPSSAQSE